jgi:hypothetical protein
MFKLTCCNKTNPLIWDKQAAELGGGFFHCHASIVYMAELSGNEPIFFEARDNENRCLGIAAGTIDSSKKWPFSRYCRIALFPATPIADGDQDTERWLLENIEQRLRDMGVFKIKFASYHSHNSNRLLLPLGYEISLRHEYEFDLGLDLDDLFRAFHKEKRRQVRKAEKLGVVTREVNTFKGIQLVEYFHDISMQRRGYPNKKTNEKKKKALKKLFKSKKISILISYLNKEPLCGYLLGVFNGHVYGLISGSSDLGNKNYAPVHMRWTGINMFKDQGFNTFSIGGAREKESGLRKFKKYFGTIETYQPSGVKIFPGVGSFLAVCRRFVSRG